MRHQRRGGGGTHGRGHAIRLRVGSAVPTPVAIRAVAVRVACRSVRHRGLRRPLPRDGGLRPCRAWRDRRGDGEPVHVPATAVGRPRQRRRRAWRHRVGAAAGCSVPSRADAPTGARSRDGATPERGWAADVRRHLAGPARYRDVDGRELRHRARQPVAAAAGRRADHRVGLLVERVQGDVECRRAAERVPADIPQHVLRVRGARCMGGGHGRVLLPRRTGGRS